ncbi:LRR domain containing protein, partial [Trema orientale]
MNEHLISYLNVASNKLSGSLTDKLNCGAKLGLVDISSNRLMGGNPHCLASNSDKRVVKYNGNCLSMDSEHQHHGSYCRETIKGDKSSRGTHRIAKLSEYGTSITREEIEKLE